MASQSSNIHLVAGRPSFPVEVSVEHSYLGNCWARIRQLFGEDGVGGAINVTIFAEPELMREIAQAILDGVDELEKNRATHFFERRCVGFVRREHDPAYIRAKRDVAAREAREDQ